MISRLFSCLLISLFLFASSSLADNNENMKALQVEIDEARSGSTITLDSEKEYIGGITVAKSLDFECNGYSCVLNGALTERVLHVLTPKKATYRVPLFCLGRFIASLRSAQCFAPPGWSSPPPERSPPLVGLGRG